MIRISNCLPVQPVVIDQDLAVGVNNTGLTRGNTVIIGDYTNVTTIDLTVVPILNEWVEVYVDGQHLINSTLDFNTTHTGYEISGQTLTFTTPVTGHIVISIDQTNPITMPTANYISVSNVQGANSKAKTGVLAGTNCEPVVVVQPAHGYVRITDDRLQMVFVPNAGFQGYDSFSYTVLTDRGQLANPKCIYVRVGNPS